MSAERAGPLDITLLSSDRASPAGTLAAALAAGLRERGHRAFLVTTAGTDSGREDGTLALPRVPEAPLRARGFFGPVAQVPLVAAALAGRRVDVVHALTPTDAVAGQFRRRLGGAPLIFTSVDPPSRETFAARRLSFSINTRAFLGSDAVVAAGDDVRAAIERWLAISVRSIEGADAVAYEGLYRSLVT